MKHWAMCWLFCSAHAQMYPIAVESLSEQPMERYVYDISVADNENFLTSQGIFVHNSRAGAQVPFSSLNVGSEITPEGRAVTRNSASCL